MKLLLATTVLFIIVAMAGAAPIEISAGPYNISFELNTTMEYNVTLHPEVEDNESSWYYTDIILDDGSRAAIGITTHKEWQPAGYPCIYWENLYLRAAKDAGEILSGNASETTIDGNDGYIIRQEILKPDNRIINSTIAEYWLDAEEIEGYGIEAARTEVEMILLLPENLTKDLLRTIHVEANNPESTLAIMAYEGEPGITVRDQTDADPTGTVVIPEVISQGPAYVVVLDQAGDVMGYQAVGDGVNRNVIVALNSTPSSQWLYATLNKGGAIRSPWWKYPFVPDADVTSNMFLDQRGTSDSRRATSLGSNTDAWLSQEDSTSTMSPNYSRSRCMEQMKANGYPPSTAAFFCD